MTDHNIFFVLGLLLIVGWFGTTAYTTYAKHKAEMARIESNAEDFRRSIATLGEANVAAAKVNGEALSRAIERLAERGEK